jgi:monothiol glutaredoxin
MTNILEKIQQTISANDVVLYMKGNKDFPQCGFSAAVLHILKTAGVNFLDIDVLRDPEVRQGIKEFSDWPTIPQLYVKGEFIGGCDIVKEMAQSGELQEMLKEKGII